MRQPGLYGVVVSAGVTGVTSATRLTARFTRIGPVRLGDDLRFAAQTDRSEIDSEN
jgi:hypothetical protein